jgi:hypothetical protein
VVEKGPATLKKNSYKLSLNLNLPSFRLFLLHQQNLNAASAFLCYPIMSHVGDTDFDQLTRTLTENFNVLADEVQLLSDRKTVLEHKLRFAHEQVCVPYFIASAPTVFYDETL